MQMEISALCRKLQGNMLFVGAYCNTPLRDYRRIYGMRQLEQSINKSTSECESDQDNMKKYGKTSPA